MNPIELGKFLASLRNEKGLTQDDLASILFIDKRKVSRWECGTSIPDFDTLIKLSEIFGVSLYEISICKKVKNDSRFKNLKELKNHKIKLLLISIFGIIILSFFIFASIYTIKNYNAYSVYELKSMDEDFYIEGKIIKTKVDNYFYIYKFEYPNKIEWEAKYDCEYEIYQDSHRISLLSKNSINQQHDQTKTELKPNQQLLFNIICKNEKSSYKFILTK